MTELSREYVTSNNDNIAAAKEINLPDGKRIWVTKGRPFWCHTSPRSIDLTDKEIFEIEQKFRIKLHLED